MADTSTRLRPDPLVCGDEHLPGCFNPWHDLTWCICGQTTWPGQVGTWHSRPVHEPAAGSDPRPWTIGNGAPGLRDQQGAFLGWDVYFLPAREDQEHTDAA
jgi:hypothetical protein